ncbi:divergent polysaccharide deacetylase family protein [uncultured Gilliamella sp.]|uniref:divergent polysaccharide deacetylase family protein n=1 Tax=uncultured Gilliamella sp. TaxID=1193505 RepID=UPI0025F8C384|nr:divergent polysaccharide deacetylase family protein [uncultured Gilliamella sp.]
MISRIIILIIFSLFVLNSPLVWASNLVIVIDDFGYRQHNEEQIISFSPNITVAILPHSPNAKRIATLAKQNGNDVIIHLPMAPLGKQPLEKDTLYPSMNKDQISRIIDDAVKNVPYAIGVNNHMGSLMTSDLKGMEQVMDVLSHYSLFFLDSKTISKTQVKRAASKYNIPVVERDVFLDDEQNEQAITHQLDQAIYLARKNGFAIAIGHPYPQTVNVLRKKLLNLPDDIQLMKLSHLVNATVLHEGSQITFKELLEKYQRLFYEIYYFYILQE